jgi:hypothetical protein
LVRYIFVVIAEKSLPGKAYHSHERRESRNWLLLRVNIFRAKPTEKAMGRHLLGRPSAATVLKESTILLTEFGN